jgi:outer membrane protein assembly factor BamE (lipoprotein component of BamABCDE complex)
MSVLVSSFKGSVSRSTVLLSGACIALGVLSGCTGVGDTLKPRQNFTNGYVVDQQALDQVPVGSSREQVILSLGSPSTTNIIDGREALYYISQQRTRAVAFARSSVVSQRVLAVYFGEDARVERIADYGLQDGKVFDFITRTTPTGGADQGFIIGVIRGLAGGGSGAGQARSVFDGI